MSTELWWLLTAALSIVSGWAGWVTRPRHRRAVRRLPDGTVMQKLTVRPLRPMDRWWYRKLGITAPTGTSMIDGRLARHVPYRFRWFHRRFAASRGFCWIPCPLCDRPYGGHESGGGIPDPLNGPGRYIGICSRCTRSGHGS